MNIDKEVELFKDEICSKCKAKDCNKGLVLSIWNKQLILKCFDYTPDNNNYIEIDRYYEKE